MRVAVLALGDPKFLSYRSLILYRALSVGSHEAESDEGFPDNLLGYVAGETDRTLSGLFSRAQKQYSVTSPCGHWGDIPGLSSHLEVPASLII